MENTVLTLTEILKAWEANQITPKVFADLLVWGGFVNSSGWLEVYTAAMLSDNLGEMPEIKKQTSVKMPVKSLIY